jgi:hypothetical protein
MSNRLIITFNSHDNDMINSLSLKQLKYLGNWKVNLRFMRNKKKYQSSTIDRFHYRVVLIDFWCLS